MAKTRSRAPSQNSAVTARVTKSDTVSRPTTAFEERLFKLCKLIPAGKVSTYGAMAGVLASSARAVGQGMKRNPFAPIVPCHRVIASDLSLGGFSALTEAQSTSVPRKRRMLEQEGVQFNGNKVSAAHVLLLSDLLALA